MFTNCELGVIRFITDKQNTQFPLKITNNNYMKVANIKYIISSYKTNNVWIDKIRRNINEKLQTIL